MNLLEQCLHLYLDSLLSSSYDTLLDNIATRMVFTMQTAEKPATLNRTGNINAYCLCFFRQVVRHKALSEVASEKCTQRDMENRWRILSPDYLTCTQWGDSEDATDSDREWRTTANQPTLPENNKINCISQNIVFCLLFVHNLQSLTANIIHMKRMFL